jgi:hypothetical protein
MPKPFEIREKNGTLQVYSATTKRWLWVNPETINKFIKEGQTKYDAAIYVAQKEDSMFKNLGVITKTIEEEGKPKKIKLEII